MTVVQLAVTELYLILQSVSLAFAAVLCAFLVGNTQIAWSLSCSIQTKLLTVLTQPNPAIRTSVGTFRSSTSAMDLSLYLCHCMDDYVPTTLQYGTSSSKSCARQKDQ